MTSELEVLEAEAILGLAHWWSSLGLDRRTRHVLMRASFEPEKVESAARIGGRIEAAFLGQRFDLDEVNEEEEEGREAAIGEELHEQIDLIMGRAQRIAENEESRLKLEQVRISIGDLIAVSQVMDAETNWRKNTALNSNKTSSSAAANANNNMSQSSSSTSTPTSKSNEVSHRCDRCKKGFPSAAALKAHIRASHETSMAFICSYCGMLFGRQESMAEHEAEAHAEDEDDPEKKSSMMNFNNSRRNRRVRDLPCPQCDSYFSTNWLLKQHVSVVHWGERKFECGFCGKKFGYSHHLSSHITSQHSASKKRKKNNV